MFRIRSDQMQRLGARTRERFVARMADYLRAQFPRWVAGLSEEQLTQWTTQALAKADRYGVRTEPEAAQLVLLFVVLGLDADEASPWVRDVLTDPDLVAAGKVRTIARLAHDRNVAGLEQVLVFPELEG